MYYNTNNLKSEELEKGIFDAKNQDNIIEKFIKESTNNNILTCRIIWCKLPIQIELTSLRRSINTLIKKGLIQYKTDEKGKYCLHKHRCLVSGFMTTERIIIKA
jgi:hypothetical protein